MVGNDVVDLRDVDADITTYRERFDARVFRREEREAIAAEVLGPSTRWQLWAAKEACFKAAKQEDPKTVFAPQTFEVWFEKRWVEIFMPVQHSSGSFMVVLEPAHDRVHALAARDASEFGNVLQSVVPCDLDASGIPVDPSGRVRTAAREAVAKQLQIDVARVEIQNEGRVPTLYLDGDRMAVSTSLSHHGRWLAFAIALDAACEARGGRHVSN